MRYLLCCAVIALGACGSGVHASLGGGARAPKGPATSADAEAEAEVRRPVGPMVEERGAAGAREEREEVIAYLVGVAHAEPHRHEIAAEHERRERERRLMSDAERAARREADALQTRARVRAYLVALGAKERPPRPAPLPEEPGEPPFEGAVWGRGGWQWRDGQWAWSPGSWGGPRDDGSAAIAGVDLALGILDAVLGDSDGDGGGSGRRRSAHREGGVRDHRRGDGDPIVRDHRSGKRDDAAPIVRDHRADRSSEPVIRDHRETKLATPSPIVRDHREHRERARDQAPVVRDHRDSKKDDDDRKPVTRDHRR